MAQEADDGCDVPMLNPQPVPRVIDATDVTVDATHRSVSLEPDLPPLAIEHPARLWNSLLHSLPSGLQPIVKWDYSRFGAAEPSGGENRTIIFEG